MNVREIDYSTVPVDYMADGMKRYVEHGIDPGHFMYSILSNNLFGAVSRADLSNQQNIVNWVKWIYNNLPKDAYGSVDTVENWMNSKKQ